MNIKKVLPTALTALTLFLGAASFLSAAPRPFREVQTEYYALVNGRVTKVGEVYLHCGGSVTRWGRATSWICQYSWSCD